MDGTRPPGHYSGVARLNQVDRLRLAPLFALVFIISGCVLSEVANVVTEATLLPKLHPTTQSLTEPLRVTNNDGSLSNGEKLIGWRKHAYFVTSGLLWMLLCVGTMLVVIHLWPAAEDEKPEAGSAGLTSRTPERDRTVPEPQRARSSPKGFIASQPRKHLPPGVPRTLLRTDTEERLLREYQMAQQQAAEDEK